MTIIASSSVIDPMSILTTNLTMQVTTKEELVNLIDTLVVANNRVQLYTIYCLGVMLNSEKVLKDKFDTDVEELCGLTNLSRQTLWSYKSFAKGFTPAEVMQLATNKVSFTATLIVNKLRRQDYLEEADALKSALLLGEISSIKDTTKYYDELMASLNGCPSLPQLTDTTLVTNTAFVEEPITAEVVDAEVIDKGGYEQDPYQDNTSYAEAVESNEDEDDDEEEYGKSIEGSHRRAFTQVGIAQSMLTKVSTEIESVLDRIQSEMDILINDADTTDYDDIADRLRDVSEDMLNTLKTVAKSYKRLKDEGYTHVELPKDILD